MTATARQGIEAATTRQSIIKSRVGYADLRASRSRDSLCSFLWKASDLQTGARKGANAGGTCGNACINRVSDDAEQSQRLFKPSTTATRFKVHEPRLRKRANGLRSHASSGR